MHERGGEAKEEAGQAGRGPSGREQGNGRAAIDAQGFGMPADLVQLEALGDRVEQRQAGDERQAQDPAGKRDLPPRPGQVTSRVPAGAGGDEAAARGRITLTCLAYNTVAVFRRQAGVKLAALGIRRLPRVYEPALGAAPAVIYIGEGDAVLALEELSALLGRPVRDSLLPSHAGRAPPPAWLYLQMSVKDGEVLTYRLNCSII